MDTVLLADRVTAIPWALTGVTVLQPAPEALPGAFRQALAGAELVLVTRPLAAQLPAGELEAAILTANPPVQVIGPAFAPRVAPEVVDRVRRSLGVAR